VALAALLACTPCALARAGGDPGPAPATARAGGPARQRTLEIDECRVEGADHFTTLELESVLNPFLGPGRAIEDVEAARAALEKAYSDRGYQSVAVAIPPQTVRGGVVTLKVTEGKIGRLRVHGARWFLPSDIKRQAPSMAEGTVPNFNDIVRDIVVLNQLPDRRVTPALRAGAIPGTVDVDLNVQDKVPLHGSFEVNNRYSAGTTQIRLNGSLRYDNLWQMGHSLTFSFQVAPKRIEDGEVYSASYLARFPDTPWLSFTLNGLIQDSDVSTLGGIAVAGKGRVFGGRVNFTLPGTEGFFHTLGAGIDYKHFLEGVTLGSDTQGNPIVYWPATAQYVASVSGKASQTQLTAAVVFNIRGFSSGADRFDAKRYGASGNFTYFRGGVERTEELPRGLQLFGRLQGQYSASPLIGSEQFTAGGADSVRGYLEVQAAGDYGMVGGLELRSPSIAKQWGAGNDLRILLFADGGRVRLNEPLPEQKDLFLLWSVGAGARLKLLEHVSGSFDVGVPLRSEGATTKYHPRFSFRVWSEF
jgi:hemolysin activation/secretion protein